MCRSRQQGYQLSINNNVKKNAYEKKTYMKEKEKEEEEDIHEMIKYAIASTTSVFIYIKNEKHL